MRKIKKEILKNLIYYHKLGNFLLLQNYLEQIKEDFPQLTEFIDNLELLDIEDLSALYLLLVLD